MNIQSQANQAIVLLRQSYLGKLLDRMIVIENASIRLGEAPQDEKALGALKRECHKLSGISHSLGFVAIGDIATEIDCAIAIQKAGWDALEPVVENLLDAMEKELD